jgi:hypothetical protein
MWPHVDEAARSRNRRPNRARRCADFADYVIAAYHWLARESETSPKMMPVCLHLRMIGRPGRTGALNAILRHVTQGDAAWNAPRADIARHWLKRFPAGLADG